MSARKTVQRLALTLAWKLGPREVFVRAAATRRRHLTQKLRRTFGDRVRYGPFKGLRLSDTSSWFDGDRAAKLIGTYEANLRSTLERAIDRAPQLVINIGCAEGYYAVGLALALPNTQVFARDIDPKAIEACQACAQTNGVGDRVFVGGECECSALSSLIGASERVLLFLDCEGAELDLIDPLTIPRLANCDLIVEMHEFRHRGVTETIVGRLSRTHDVQRVPQGARDPNGIAEIATWSETDRWLVVDERRPESMTWLACWARASSNEARLR